ncbi:coiled-coil domain-containing protein [Caniella muris]|uniref:coiled-coil domain-containing protein n=1 Tax=Caniella muris TaxID=2941502 RepID=UPI00203C24EC|nr:hypothetical protein [Caniella muris]
MERPSIASRLLGTALALLLAGALVPCSALADADAPEADLSELQERIESSGAAFDEASAKAAELEEQAAENQRRIDEVRSQIPAQREKASAAINASYKMHQDTPGLLGLVLSSNDFNEFLTTITYLNAVEDHNVDQVQRLADLQDELDRNQSELEQKLSEAEQQKKEAETALQEAKAAREEAQRQAEEKARREAEEAAAAVAAAQAQAAQQAPAGQEAQPAPSQSTPSSVDWSQDKQAFVGHWAPRIDAYLAGSPLGGQGKTFADAAWDYGVDPRWSPAISNTESSKGLYCFKPHNAWGWGSSSWDSWEEAIRDHVAGLARIYGPTISMEAARKYCPPNADHWYSATLAEMERI